MKALVVGIGKPALGYVSSDDMGVKISVPVTSVQRRAGSSLKSYVSDPACTVEHAAYVQAEMIRRGCSIVQAAVRNIDHESGCVEFVLSKTLCVQPAQIARPGRSYAGQVARDNLGLPFAVELGNGVRLY